MSDYISREEINRVLLNRINMNSECLSGARESKHFEEEKYFSTLIFEDEQIASLIEELPSADVRPNIHGEWIFYDEEFYQQGRFAGTHHRIRECSFCHHKIVDFVGNMNFCPNCGADMREPKEKKGTK